MLHPTAARWREPALDLLYDLAGGLLYAAGLHLFAAQGNFSTGGVSGLALILNHLAGFPLGLTSLVLNVPVVALSLRVVGRRFLLKSLRTMAVCFFLLDVVFPRFPAYQGSALLAALYAGALLGGGLGLFYLRGSSSGGADFVIVSIKTLRPHLSMGSVTMALDFCIILLGWPVFGSLDAVLYGLVSTAACSVVLDKILCGAGSGKLVLVITTVGPQVAQAISRKCGRGCTITQAVGGFTGQARQILLCACARAQAPQVRAAAWQADPASFVMITDTSEVFGEGFLPPG